MRKFLALALLLCPIAYGQTDCSSGTCAGNGSPLAQTPIPKCRPGTIYSDTSSPGVLWVGTGSPCTWTVSSGGGGGGIVDPGANGIMKRTAFNATAPATAADITALLTYTPLSPSLNLSDLSNAVTARGNLSLGSAAVQAGTVGALVGTTDVQTLTNKTVDGVPPATLALLSSVTAAQGNGIKLQLSTGTTTTNDCTKFDASGNVVDAGAPCSAGGGLADPGSNGIMKRTALNTTGPAVAADIAAALGNQSPALVYAGPASGSAAAPGFRALVSTDLPALGYTPLNAANNLSDVANAATARTNLGIGFNLTIKTANYTINSSTDLNNARFEEQTAGTTITLPTAVGISGTCYWIKNATAGTITVATTSSQTIFTSSAVSSITMNPGDGLEITSNGSNWDKF